MIYETQIYFQASGIDLEIDVDVDYDYHPPCKGSRGSCGEPLEPDEGASVEINFIKSSKSDEDTNLFTTELIDLFEKYGDLSFLEEEILTSDDEDYEPECRQLDIEDEVSWESPL